MAEGENNITGNGYGKILKIPVRDDGSEYSVESLHDDQRELVCVVLNTLHEFLHIQDLNHFKPYVLYLMVVRVDLARVL